MFMINKSSTHNLTTSFDLLILHLQLKVERWVSIRRKPNLEKKPRKKKNLKVQISRVAEISTDEGKFF